LFLPGLFLISLLAPRFFPFVQSASELINQAEKKKKNVRAFSFLLLTFSFPFFFFFSFFSFNKHSLGQDKSKRSFVPDVVSGLQKETMPYLMTRERFEDSLFCSINTMIQEPRQGRLCLEDKFAMIVVKKI